jgi:regulator of protease activity HflC (stomatin/prohibitin superfamily)
VIPRVRHPRLVASGRLESADAMRSEGVTMLYVLIIILIGIFIVLGLRIADQYQRAVVFRLGRYVATRGPGLCWIIPFLEWQQTIDIRVVTAAVEQQETITKDNVPIKINAVVWYRILDPRSAVLELRSVDNAVIQVALTTLRTGIGQYTLDDLLKEQEAVSSTIGQKIDAVTEPWGVKVERVEMKNVEIPESMQRAIAQEAEALREKRRASSRRKRSSKRPNSCAARRRSSCRIRSGSSCGACR